MKSPPIETYKRKMIVLAYCILLKGCLLGVNKLVGLLFTGTDPVASYGGGLGGRPLGKPRRQLMGGDGGTSPMENRGDVPPGNRGDVPPPPDGNL